MTIDKYRKATLGPLEFWFPELGAKNADQRRQNPQHDG